MSAMMFDCVYDTVFLVYRKLRCEYRLRYGQDTDIDESLYLDAAEDGYKHIKTDRPDAE
jgi:hypothetical protein